MHRRLLIASPKPRVTKEQDDDAIYGQEPETIDNFLKEEPGSVAPQTPTLKYDRHGTVVVRSIVGSPEEFERFKNEGSPSKRTRQARGHNRYVGRGRFGSKDHSEKQKTMKFDD